MGWFNHQPVMVQNGLSKKSITTTEAYGESRVEPDKNQLLKLGC